jgi:hypothetical protein
MLKRTIVAAATAAALAGAALATAAPAAAAEAGFIEMHGPGQWQGNGQWNGPGQWHGGNDQWRHGKKKFKQVRRSCEPIVRWVWSGHGHPKRPIVVGWNCDRRHNWNPYW